MIALGIFKHKKEKYADVKKDYSAIEWPGHVVNLGKKNFEEFIKKYPLSVIDFWAPWCGPCKAMLPRLRRLSVIYKSKVAFGRLNTQENQDLAKKYRIAGIPHLAFFRYGKKISSSVGLKSVGDIKKDIDDFLKEED